MQNTAGTPAGQGILLGVKKISRKNFFEHQFLFRLKIRILSLNSIYHIKSRMQDDDASLSNHREAGCAPEFHRRIVDQLTLAEGPVDPIRKDDA